MKFYDYNWMQIEQYLLEDDRVVVPLGSVEQHAYLSLGTDAILAERCAVEATEGSNVPVLPVLPFGLTPRFVEFPGTITLRATVLYGSGPRHPRRARFPRVSPHPLAQRPLRQRPGSRPRKGVGKVSIRGPRSYSTDC